MRTPVMTIFRQAGIGAGPHYFPLQSGLLDTVSAETQASQRMLPPNEPLAGNQLSRWRVSVNTPPGAGNSFVFRLYAGSFWQFNGTDTQLHATITISDAETSGIASGPFPTLDSTASGYCTMTRVGNVNGSVVTGKSSLLWESSGEYQTGFGHTDALLLTPRFFFSFFGNAMASGGSGQNTLNRRKIFPIPGTLLAFLETQIIEGFRIFSNLDLYKNGSVVSSSGGDLGQIIQFPGTFPMVPGDWVVVKGNLAQDASTSGRTFSVFYPDTPDENAIMSNVGGGAGAQLVFSATPAFISPMADHSHSLVESDVTVVAPIGMALSHLLLAISPLPGGSKIVTATLRVNGADTALAVSLTGFQQFVQNTADTVYVAAGDLLSIKLTTNGPTVTQPEFVCASMKAVCAADAGDSYDVGSHLTGTETASYQVGSFLAPIPSEGKFSPYEVGSHLAGAESYSVSSHLSDEPMEAYLVGSRVQARLGDGEGWAGPWNLFDRA